MLAQGARLTTHAPDGTEHAPADSTKRRPGRSRTRVASAGSFAPGSTKRAPAHPLAAAQAAVLHTAIHNIRIGPG
jgi:hypothetical protein